MPEDRTIEIESEAESTAAVAKKAVTEASELVRLEVELAKEELRAEVKRVEGAAISFALAIMFAILVFAMLGVALLLAMGATLVHALLVSAAFLVVAGILGVTGYALLPKNPMWRTRENLATDAHRIKEHAL